MNRKRSTESPNQNNKVSARIFMINDKKMPLKSTKQKNKFIVSDININGNTYLSGAIAAASATSVTVQSFHK